MFRKAKLTFSSANSILLLRLRRQIEPLEPAMIFGKNLEVVDVVLLLRAVVAEFGSDGGVLVDADVEEDRSDVELR